MRNVKQDDFTRRLLPGASLPDGSALVSGLRCQLWCRVSGDIRYLDGNQHTGTVQTLAEDLAQQPQFTGVNWVLEARPDGLWALLNQGDPNFALIGTGTDVRLGRLNPQTTRDATAEWIVYVSDQGKLLLRPVLGEWLIAEDNTGGVALGRCSAADTAKSLWTVTPRA
ncbi:MAG: hypothetical protein IE922_00285 [Sphingomonadales bacterium]|nr:hypothetical protein [Sphingomonadales bacterium]